MVRLGLSPFKHRVKWREIGLYNGSSPTLCTHSFPISTSTSDRGAWVQHNHTNDVTWGKAGSKTANFYTSVRSSSWTS
eukprot:2105268-Amphidinium_carterae.2